MGDIADDIIDDLIGREDLCWHIERRSIRKKRTIVCNNCGIGKLHWHKFGPEWQLKTNDNQLHKCKEEDIYEHLSSRCR